MTGTLADADLVRAAQAGDAASLGMLLERHRAAMQAVALNLLGYGPDAQDAVQDAMLIALQQLGELRDPTAAGAWLRAIVRNACRMRLRVTRTTHLDDEAIHRIPAREPLPEELLDQHVLREWVWHALEELSEPLQLVVLLRYFSNMSRYDQIASLCGVPIGTVRSRLNQARLKLSAALLASAAMAHNDAGLLIERRRREAHELFAEAASGDLQYAFGDAWSDDLLLIGPQGQQLHGRERLAEIMQSDYHAGVRQRPLHVTASRHFTIMECELLNPPWDPQHCPPGVVWLLTIFHQRVESVRLFHPQPTENVSA